MVLHKELRVLARGTPCVIQDVHGMCSYSGMSDSILTRLTSIQSPIRDSFVKRVNLITSESDDYNKYDFNHESFLVITVKLKEDK